MAKRQRSSVLMRLAGKRVYFGGNFDRGIEQSLKSIVAAQQGIVCDDLDDKVDYLVVAELGSGNTIQKKAISLNGRGAAIQVLDGDAFKNLAEPTDAEVLTLLRAGESESYMKIRGPYYEPRVFTPKYTFHAEDVSGVHLQGVWLDDIHFDGCSFRDAKFEHERLGAVTDCDFSKITGVSCQFADIPGCRFRNSTLNGCLIAGDLSGADFTGAALTETAFVGSNLSHFGLRDNPTVQPNVLFSKATLKSATFRALNLKSPDFGGADLTKARFHDCVIETGTFRSAKLGGAVFVGCKLPGADLSNADLTGANLADADLTGAILASADLKNANLRGTKLTGVDLSRAKNYDPQGAASGTVGPALMELDNVNAQAKRIHVMFHVSPSENEDGDRVGIESAGLQWGRGVQLAPSIGVQVPRGGNAFSDAMLQLANLVGHLRVRYETVEVSSIKSPKRSKELRDLVLRGIAEAFTQEIPAKNELAAATKNRREAEREKGAADRESREQAKAAAAKQKEKAKKQIARKVEKAVGKVSDVASFLKALEVRIEKPKIEKATKMLKASGFKLFNDVTEQSVSGVVKSLTDPDLVYACRVLHDGQYACCTQNLNICGGLRGSICKHLLVLIIGLVQAGELDPTTIDAWIAKTHSVKPELDKDVMGDIFIKYKGAEAGEVDWRPTETVPEDYYTL